MLFPKIIVHNTIIENTDIIHNILTIQTDTIHYSDRRQLLLIF